MLLICPISICRCNHVFNPNEFLLVFQAYHTAMRTKINLQTLRSFVELSSTFCGYSFFYVSIFFFSTFCCVLEVQKLYCFYGVATRIATNTKQQHNRTEISQQHWFDHSQVASSNEPKHKHTKLIMQLWTLILNELLWYVNRPDLCRGTIKMLQLFFLFFGLFATKKSYEKC